MAPYVAAPPICGSANRSLSHTEPVSGTSRRKLENGEQRLTPEPPAGDQKPQNCRPETRAHRHTGLTRGNVDGSHTPGNNGVETALAGCPGRIRTGLRAASVLVIGGRRIGRALGANSLDAMSLVGRYLARNCVSYQPGEPRPNSGRQAHSPPASNAPLLMALMSLQCSPKVISLMPSARRGFRRTASAGCFRPKRRPAFLIDSSAAGRPATARRGTKAAEQESPTIGLVMQASTAAACAVRFSRQAVRVPRVCRASALSECG